MDEFDIYLESAGSMIKYSGNTMAAFRKLLAHPIHLEGDWRVALAAIIFPTSIKNITTTGFFIYTLNKTLYDNTPVPSIKAGAVIKRSGQILLSLKLGGIRQLAAFWSLYTRQKKPKNHKNLQVM